MPEQETRRVGQQIMSGVTWLLWAFVKRALFAVGFAGLAGLLALVLLLGFLASIRPDTPGNGAVSPGQPGDLLAEAAEAARANSGSARSFDGAESAHQLPSGLIAAVVHQARSEGAPLTAATVAARLAPQFRYQRFVLTTERWVPVEGAELNQANCREFPYLDGNPDPNRCWRKEVTRRTVEALAMAETYRGTFRYSYQVQPVVGPASRDERLHRESVTFQPVPGRLPEALSELLGRSVEPWEADWLEGLAGDLNDDPGAVGRWLLHQYPGEL